MWGPAAAWAAVLFLLSAWPDPQLRSVFIGQDRIVHAGLYTVLGASLAYGRVRASAPPHLVLLFVGALYGATDEWHQAYVPGRSPDIVDWFADLTGVLLGYGAVLLIFAWLAHRASGGAEPMTDVAD